jgi:lipoteichoic acid synthase
MLVWVEKTAIMKAVRKSVPSLKNLISDEQCTSAWLGDLLSSDRLPAQYIAHKRGDNRDIISIFYGGRELRVKLDGDDTRILNPENLDDAILKLIVNKINNERISRQRES